MLVLPSLNSSWLLNKEWVTGGVRLLFSEYVEAVFHWARQDDQYYLQVTSTSTATDIWNWLLGDRRDGRHRSIILMFKEILLEFRMEFSCYFMISISVQSWPWGTLLYLSSNTLVERIQWNQLFSSRSARVHSKINPSELAAEEVLQARRLCCLRRETAFSLQSATGSSEYIIYS